MSVSGYLWIRYPKTGIYCEPKPLHALHCTSHSGLGTALQIRRVEEEHIPIGNEDDSVSDDRCVCVDPHRSPDLLVSDNPGRDLCFIDLSCPCQEPNLSARSKNAGLAHHTSTWFFELSFYHSIDTSSI